MVGGEAFGRAARGRGQSVTPVRSKGFGFGTAHDH